MTKTRINKQVSHSHYYEKKHLTQFLTKKRSHFFILLLLYLSLNAGTSFSQNTITFDDQGHFDNSIIGNPYSIVNNGENFKFTSSGGTHKYRSTNSDLCPDPGVSYIAIETASATTWTIETVSGNDINLGTIRFDNIYACPLYNYEYSLTIQGFQNGSSTGSPQAFTTTGFNSIFTSNASFNSIDKIVITCSDLFNLGIDDINWESAAPPPCTDPTIPTITSAPGIICDGNSALLTISGTKNDATEWKVYTGSCGGTEVASTTSSTVIITPVPPATTYYVRGEGGCVTPGSCGTITVTTTAREDATFNYGAAAYCVDDSDPTPTITGVGGGTFSSGGGLSLNASSGKIDVSASTPGTYTVNYQTSGLCDGDEDVSVTINALDDPSFSYSAATYCANISDPSPTITGLAGGIFSSGPGLSINAASGLIDVSASTPATYTVTYTTTGVCPNSSSVSVTVNAADNASFSYSAAAYCVDDSDPTPTITGLAGGSFSSGAGLSINSGSGKIDVSTSTPGTYTVTYTTVGTCPNSSGQSMTINALDNASFTYSAAAYCVDASDPTPVITGLVGGGYSSGPGLSLNGGSGKIDVSASVPGIYTVTYTTAGSCPNSSSQSVTINALDNPSFTYSAAAYCVDASDPTPVITGLAGGNFSSGPGLSINGGNGKIDVSASVPGIYTVTYTTAGSCPNSSSQSVTINALDNASFTYSAAAYCVDASDPTPVITGLVGGSFSSGAGLSINGGSGKLDVSVSVPGIYTVTYTTVGTCPNSSSQSVTINALDNASFIYSAAAYCVNASDPTPVITGLAGGGFSSGAGLSINGGSGKIDVSASAPGIYTVTYTTAGSCPNSSSQSVTINALDNASFTYSAAAYCVDASDPTPVITGLVGGSFSSGAGLSVNGGSGLVDVSASVPGIYTVTYTTVGICPNSSSQSVTINALDNASFTYSAAAYCVDASDPTPVITGLVGGSFSSGPGLSLNGGSGKIDVSASVPGIYTVTYTTAGSCPNSSSQSVSINALDDASFTYSAADYCIGDVDPAPTITGLAGGSFSSGAGLSINGGSGLIDVSVSTPGIYTVTYTTVGSCPTSSSQSVTIYALDDASFSYSAAAYCVDDSDPTPTITGKLGGSFSSGVGLSLTSGSGLIDVSASIPGIYTITYTTVGVCSNSSSQSVTINALDDASFTYSAAAYCVDASDPTPVITGLVGGSFTSGAGLSINGGSGKVDVSTSVPGIYTVTYTTVGACPNSSSQSVTINALDNASFTYSAAAYCVDASDPTPVITGLAGGSFTSGAGLSINGGSGKVDVSASVLGIYTVTYTTVGSCPNSSNQSVTINALDNASFTYSAAAYCVDASDPTPVITGLAGGSFTSEAGLSINGGSGKVDVSASVPGIYTVTYTTSGSCPNSSNQSVTINALDDASFSYSAAVYCVDASDPTPTITGLVGGSFTSGVGLSINGGSGKVDVSASVPGTYTVTYTTTGNCPNSSGVSVTVNALDNPSFNYSAAVYCVDASDPTPSITGLAGGIFSSGPGLSLNAASGLVDVSASTPGTYTITYTTTGVCPNSSSVSVTINALDDASFSYAAPSYCIGDNDPTPSITGLAGGIFSSGPGLSINAGSGLIDVSASTPGVYTVTYTTTGVCPTSANQSVTIYELDDASFFYSAAAYCVDASDPTPTITGALGGIFSSGPGLSLNSGSGLIDVSVSTPGIYTVTYTTTGTCSNSSSQSVTINALDDASFNYSAAAYCVDASDPNPTISGLPGGIFSSGIGLSINPGSGLIDVSAGTPGTYTVTYTTTGICPNSSNVSVTVNALDDASFSYGASSYCSNDSDPSPTITGLAGGTFFSGAGLSINAITGAVDVSASTPGVYTVTYTTAGSCPNSSLQNVTINAVVATIVVDANVSCNGFSDGGATASATGGTGVYTFAWSNAASTTSITGVIAGTYSVTITDNNGCTDSESVTIMEPEVLVVDDVITSNVTGCEGDENATITIMAMGGTPDYMYSKDNASTWQTSNLFEDLAAGAYDIYVKDANDCISGWGTTIHVNEPVPIVITLNEITNIDCFGNSTGAIALTVFGGTPDFSFEWVGPDEFTANTESISGLLPGDYVLTVTDANACVEISGPHTVTEPATALAINEVLSTNVDGCFGNNNGSIEILVHGGTPEYLYSINNGANFYPSPVFYGLGAGDYEVIVKDANGCETILDEIITITEPDAISVVAVDVVNVMGCFSDASGEMHITAAGGTGTLRYSINGGYNYYTNGGHFFGLTAGSYQIRIKDSNSCFYTYGTLIDIVEPDALEIEVLATTDVSICNGNTNGMIEIAAIGGTGTTLYSIDGGSNFVDNGGMFDNLGAGSYEVFISDENGCLGEYATNPVVIDEPNPMTILVTSADVSTCFGEMDGMISINVTGGIADYSYSIDGGTTWSSTGIFTDLLAGDYDVIIKDANGCTQDYSGNPVLIGEPTVIEFGDVAVTNAGCFGANDGEIMVSGIGGTGVLMFSIDGGASYQESGVITGLGAGEYELMMKDANGCEMAYENNPVIVEDGTEIIIEEVVITHVQCSGELGSITITASGGVGDFMYSINGGTDYYETNVFTDLISDTYIVRVMDGNSCNQLYDENPIVIENSQSSPVNIIINPENGPHCINEPVELEAIAEDAISFNWQPGGLSDAIIEVTSDIVQTVEYTVTVINAAGCESMASVEIEYDICESLPELESDMMTIQVYPNPNSGEFSLELTGMSQEVEISVLDFAGRLVLKDKILEVSADKMEKQFDFSDYERGIYFLKITHGDQVSYKKVIIE